MTDHNENGNPCNFGRLGESLGVGWFGKSWGAPICFDEEHIATPIGKTCVHCEEIFVDGDQGITNSQNYSWHIDCYMRGIFGGVNHIRGTCTCCGGSDHPDPPNVSKREAARLAMIEWKKKISRNASVTQP